LTSTIGLKIRTRIRIKKKIIIIILYISKNLFFSKITFTFTQKLNNYDKE